jgi:hypothetical protein
MASMFFFCLQHAPQEGSSTLHGEPLESVKGFYPEQQCFECLEKANPDVAYFYLKDQLFLCFPCTDFLREYDSDVKEKSSLSFDVSKMYTSYPKRLCSCCRKKEGYLRLCPADRQEEVLNFIKEQKRFCCPGCLLLDETDKIPRYSSTAKIAKYCSCCNKQFGLCFQLFGKASEEEISNLKPLYEKVSKECKTGLTLCQGCLNDIDEHNNLIKWNGHFIKIPSLRNHGPRDACILCNHQSLSNSIVYTTEEGKEAMMNFSIEK